nr:hypothetical protein [Candidatus Sigynarchaeota archaeon]
MVMIDHPIFVASIVIMVIARQGSKNPPAQRVVNAFSQYPVSLEIETCQAS